MEKNTCKILLTIEDGEVEGRTHVEVIDTVNCDCFDVSGVIEDFDLEQSNKGCKALKKADIPVVKIVTGDMFNDCWELEDVNMPLVETINNYGFYRCSKLKKLKLPKCNRIYLNSFGGTGLNKTLLNVLDIFGGAGGRIESDFRQTQLVSLVIRGEDGVCASSARFPADSKIYVPDSLVEQYKESTNWSLYANQIKPLSEYVEV